MATLLDELRTAEVVRPVMNPVEDVSRTARHPLHYRSDSRNGITDNPDAVTAGGTGRDDERGRAVGDAASGSAAAVVNAVPVMSAESDTERHTAAMLTAVPSPDGALLTIDEAAALLRVPRSWLRDRVSARLVPHTRLGRHVRFTAEHLAQIIAIGEQGPRATPVPTGAGHRRRA